jgi:hypothetical protein
MQEFSTGKFQVMLHELEHPPLTINNIQERRKCLPLADFVAEVGCKLFWPVIPSP